VAPDAAGRKRRLTSKVLMDWSNLIDKATAAVHGACRHAADYGHTYFQDSSIIYGSQNTQAEKEAGGRPG
jgi:hypothetical protein